MRKLTLAFFVATGTCAGIVVTSCGGDDANDDVIAGNGATDGAADGTTSTNDGANNPNDGGGGTDAPAEVSTENPLCGTDGGFGCVAPEKCAPALGCVTCTADPDCKTAGLTKCIRGECEECASNADCPAATPACWPGDHKCRQACPGANCGGQKTCDTATGQCVGCKVAGDCAAVNNKPVCDPITKECVQCTENAQCTQPGLTLCHPTELTCVGCLTHAACAALDGGATPVCDPGNFRCRAGCFTNQNCKAPTPACNKTTLTCQQCIVNGDCSITPATPKCTSQGTCVQCLATGDCSGATPKCDTTTNKCVQCLGNGDCTTAGLTKCDPAGQCVECLVKADCNGNKDCVTGKCQ
jgi:hypothetical protein